MMNTNNKVAERKLIYQLSSPQSSGKTKLKVNLTPVRKLKSRVNSKLKSKSFEKNDYYEVDLESNKATCSSGFEDASFAAFQHLNITLYYYLDNNQIETLEILIREDNIIREFIQAAINQINAKLKQDNQLFCFDTTLSDYSIKTVKKNGIPKHDLPSMINPFYLTYIGFNHNTTIHNCHELKLALTWNNESKTNLIQCPDIPIDIKKEDSKYKGNRKDTKDSKLKKLQI